MSMQPIRSIIVPFYEEDENSRRMHTASVEAVEPPGVPLEMVFVNDGSRDRTLEITTDIAREDERITAVLRVKRSHVTRRARRSAARLR